jgi:hypothetical protein
LNVGDAAVASDLTRSTVTSFGSSGIAASGPPSVATSTSAASSATTSATGDAPAGDDAQPIAAAWSNVPSSASGADNPFTIPSPPTTSLVAEDTASADTASAAPAPVVQSGGAPKGLTPAAGPASAPPAPVSPDAKAPPTAAVSVAVAEAQGGGSDETRAPAVAAAPSAAGQAGGLGPAQRASPSATEPASVPEGAASVRPTATQSPPAARRQAATVLAPSPNTSTNDTAIATAGGRGSAGHGGSSWTAAGDAQAADDSAAAPSNADPTVEPVSDPIASASGALIAAGPLASGAVQPGTTAQAMASSTTQASPTIASLSAQIAQQANQKTSRFDVQLTPEGLGRVDVAVQIDSGGNVTASLTFEKADSAALVKDQSGQLQSALASAGLSLDSLKITHLQVDVGQPPSAAAQQTVAAGGSAADPQFGGQGNGQNGGQTGQHASTSADQSSWATGNPLGGQSDGQSGGQPRQQNGASGSALALRNFQAAASAADGADLQATYASGLSSRGLDIRI